MKFLGVSDDVTTCEHCGKKNLKRTVLLEVSDGGIVHFGTDCAARALGTVNGRVAEVADVVSYAEKWLTVYPPKTVVVGIWNKFGYLCQERDGVITVKTALGTISIHREG